MKRSALSLFFSLSMILSLSAQIQSIASKKISINFDKTIHLVFKMDIDYFNVGTDDVLATIANNAPFTLKIKANTENFTKETNISVITTDGKFYSFAVGYNKTVEEATIFVDQDILPEIDSIPVSSSKSIHLLFPQDVIYSDVGNEQAISIENISASNVVRFKANYENIPQTNISVITSDRKFYSFILNYDPNPEIFNYALGEKGALATISNNEKNFSDIAKETLEKDRAIFNLGLSKNKMEFYCSNIFIKNDVLFFVCGIKNTSNINFNVDFVKCFIRDIKQLKNTTIQETEMIPLIKYNFKDAVSNKKGNDFVLAFNKFTIPDKKKFEIEIFDADGGRHLRFRIKNENIISAKKL